MIVTTVSFDRYLPLKISHSFWTITLTRMITMFFGSSRDIECRQCLTRPIHREEIVFWFFSKLFPSFPWTWSTCLARANRSLFSNFPTSDKNSTPVWSGTSHDTTQAVHMEGFLSPSGTLRVGWNSQNEFVRKKNLNWNQDTSITQDSEPSSSTVSKSSW